jgi:hypothetical protein
MKLFALEVKKSSHFALHFDVTLYNIIINLRWNILGITSEMFTSIKRTVA